MIIQCPACSTKYVVPDTAIGGEGRTVRCAKCKHSWFQENEDAEAGPRVAPPEHGEADVPVAEEPASTPAPETAEAEEAEDEREEPAPAEDAASEPAPEDAGVAPPAFDEDEPPLPEERPSPPPVAEPEPVEEDHADSHFDPEPPFRRRRNPLKLWTWAAAIFAIVVAGLVLAVSYWGLPDWVPVSRPTFAAAQPNLQLDFPPEQQERRELTNGIEFFAASGTITNTGSTTERVPDVLIVLRDAQDRIVFSMEVPPPKRNLAPGETVAVTAAERDVPRGARYAEFGWKPS
jgi:predicted Zn finger-like uncharacterized protein